MDPTTKDKLAINVKASWKMYSQRFVILFSLAVAGIAAWFLKLPFDCAPLLAKVPPEPCTVSQVSLLAKLGIGAATAPLVAGGVAWLYRVWPQTNLTPAVAAAKSADAPQPNDADHPEMNISLVSRPVPLGEHVSTLPPAP